MPNSFVRESGPIVLSDHRLTRKLGENLMVQGYCVKCRAKRDIKDPVAVKLKNGKPAMKGKCPVCGTTIMRIGATK